MKPQASLACALLLALAPIAAPARPMASNEDCEVLEKLVKKHVWLSATGIRLQPARRWLRPAPIRDAARRVCRRTAEVTTRAFAEALASLNMPVSWEPPNPGDYCRSGDLDQCYPRGRPGGPPLPGARLAFVYDAWQAVRDAVQSQVKPGRGGIAVFSAASLEAALDEGLARSVEEPAVLTLPVEMGVGRTCCGFR